MELKGKFKYDVHYHQNLKSDITIKLNVISFRSQHFSEQYGVYVDFGDSVGANIELQVRTEPTMQGAKLKSFRPEILYKGRFYNVSASFSTRERAREQAVLKLMEIYNETK